VTISLLSLLILTNGLGALFGAMGAWANATLAVLCPEVVELTPIEATALALLLTLIAALMLFIGDGLWKGDRRVWRPATFFFTLIAVGWAGLLATLEWSLLGSQPPGAPESPLPQTDLAIGLGIVVGFHLLVKLAIVYYFFRPKTMAYFGVDGVARLKTAAVLFVSSLLIWGAMVLGVFLWFPRLLD
jgi:hypothetical protein